MRHNINYPMQNGTLDENTEQNYTDSEYTGYGGSDDDSDNRPTGGFPNIVLCNENDQQKDNNVDSSRREFTADKAILSIGSILKSRRNMLINKF